MLYKQIVSLLGELGEVANAVRKCKVGNSWRIDKPREGLADIFIFEDL